MGDVGCKVVVDAYHRAMTDRVPIIGLWHSGGARLAEGVLSLHAVGRIFHAMTQASGKIPQISVVLGPAAGGAAYGPALTDVVILGPEGRIFVTGPDVVRSVTGEDVDMLRLGGPEPHGRRSGVVHILTDSEARGARPGPRRRVAARRPGQPRRRRRSRTATSPTLLPESKKRAYDVHPLVESILDEGTAAGAARQVGAQHRHRARPLRRPHGRRDRQQPAAARRLPRLAVGGEGVPLRADVRRVRRARSSSLVDVPGYLPGVGQEWDGVVRRGAKLLHAFGEASVPRVTLVTRKTYGGAYIAMNARSLGATKVFAWPGAEVAVMGAVAAVRILHRRKLAEVAARHPPAGRGRAGRRARADRRRRRQGRRDRRGRRGRRAGARPARPSPTRSTTPSRRSAYARGSTATSRSEP